MYKIGIGALFGPVSDVADGIAAVAVRTAL